MESQPEGRYRRRAAEKLFVGCLGLLLILNIVSVNAAAIKVKVNDQGQAYYYQGQAATIATLLEEEKIVLRPEDIVEPALDTPLANGMEINIKRAYPVQILTGDKAYYLWTHALSVADVLAEAGVVMGTLDEVQPNLTASPRPCQTITLTRVELKEIVEDEKVPYSLENRKDPLLARGQTRVVQNGSEGLLRKTYNVVYADGEERLRNLVKMELVKEPLSRIVVLGTAEPPKKYWTMASRGEVIVNAVYEGKASWYGGADGLHGKGTASGEMFDANALTAAHRTLPFGTIVRVTYLKSGRSVEVRINDRGPYDAHCIIDLSRAAAEAIGLKSAGTGRVKIEVFK